MIDEANPSPQEPSEKEDGVFYGSPIDTFEKPTRDIPPGSQDESGKYFYGAPIDEPAKEKPPVDPSYIAGIGADIPTPYEFKKDEGPKPDYPDAPTIANMPGISRKAAHVAMLSDDPHLIARSIMRDNPNAQYKIDSAGFPYMELPAKEEGGKGEVYYLDKPGVNMLDFSRGFARTALSVPTGLAAGAAYLAGPVAGTAAMGAAGAADAAIRQGIVRGLTGEKTFDPGEIAAEGAMSAAIPAVGAGAKRLGSWAMGLSEAPNLWEVLPRGVKNRIDVLIGNAEKRGGIQAGSDVGDMLLDDPNFVGAAKAIMRRDDEASQQLAQSLMKREAGTQARIDAAVTKTLGQEPVEKAAIKEFIELPRVEASDAINNAITEATKNNVSIPTRDIVERLDKEISTAKGGIKSALMSVRKMLTNQEIEHVGPASTRALAFEDRPAAIDNARIAIQTMLNNGFSEEGFKISSNQLKNQARILGEINSEISNRLKANVPGLKEPFEQYETMYAQKRAAELGYNFTRGGENAVTPNEIQRFLADPQNKALRPYVEAGARLRIDEMMKNTPNDLAAIKKAVKKEGDYSRENLNILFGKNRVENLADFAEKEANRQSTTKALLDDLQKSRQKTQAGIMGEPTGPAEDITSLWGLGKKAISLAPTIKRGTYGKEYYGGMADLLTKSQSELDAILQARGISNKQAREKLIEDLRKGAIAGTTVPAAGSVDQAKEQASGGRVAYKSGGRVKSARTVAEALLREIDQTRKMIGKKTEDILSLPDDAVATALKIARGNV